jgi:hypothetical protein
MPGGERLQVRYASSLKQGLEEFYKERLLPQGASGKKVVGNTLSCTLNGEARLYRALEEYQAA